MTLSESEITFPDAETILGRITTFAGYNDAVEDLAKQIAKKLASKQILSSAVQLNYAMAIDAAFHTPPREVLGAAWKAFDWIFKAIFPDNPEWVEEIIAHKNRMLTTPMA